MAKKKLTVEIAGDTKGLASAVNDADGHLNKLGGSLKTVGATAAGFISANVIQAGIGKATEFFSASVEQSTKLGESLNAVNKIFGGSADQILDWGKKNATSFGLSQASFNQLATPLGALLKNQGIKNVGDQTIELTKRAADLASVFNVDVETALAAINSGLKGEADPLEQFGVGLSAAKVEAQALADTGKKSAKSLTDQEIAQARLNLIMKESASVAGDFTATSGEYANAQRISAAKTEELQAKLGTKLVPVMQKVTAIKLALVTVLVNKLIPAFDKMTPVIKRVFGWIEANVPPILQRIGVFIREDVVPALERLGGWIRESLLPALQELARSFQENIWPILRDKVIPVLKEVGRIIIEHILPALGTFITFVIGDVIPTLFKIIEVIVDVIGKVVNFGLTVYGIGEQIAKTVSGIMGWFHDLYTDVINVFSDISIVVGNIWESVIGGIKGGINGVIGAIEWLINRAADGVNAFVGGLDWLAGPFVNAGEVGHVQLARVLHSGGTFRSPNPGGEGLALLRDGERVSSPGMGGDGVTVIVQGSVVTGRDLVAMIKEELRRGNTLG